MGSKCFTYFLRQQIDIGFYIAFLIRDFEAATQINELQFFELGYNIEQHFDALYKNIYVFYFTAGMNVQVADPEVVFFNYCQYLIDLIYGNTELTFIVAGGYFKVTACHDIGTQAKAYGIGMSVLLTEFIEVGKA